MKLRFLSTLLGVAPIFCFAQMLTVDWADSVQVTLTTKTITAPRIARLANGTPLVVWGENGPNRILCARLENGVFSAPVTAVKTPTTPALFGFGGFDVATFGDTIYIVFEQGTSGIKLAKSIDGGLVFGTPTVVQGTVPGGAATLATIATDAAGNPIVNYIREITSPGASQEIRRSTDGGLTFAPPVTVNAPAPGGKVCECCTPDLLVSGDSAWAVFRNNNANLRDIWVSRSTDLAASFTAATDVDATNWMINICPISGPKIGRFHGDSLVTAWASAASGKNRVFVSTMNGATMGGGQQVDFQPITGANAVQTQADLAAEGDTTAVIYREGKQLVFHFSTDGVVNLPKQTQVFGAAGHDLFYPSLRFEAGVFHLAYVDAAHGQVLYRQGKLAAPVSTATFLPGELCLFPNPTDGFLNIDFDGFQKNRMQWAAIFSADGQLVFEKKLAEKNGQLDLRELASGVYFLQIMDEKKSVGGVSRFIKN